MQIRFHCPTDNCVAIIEYEPLEGCGPTMQCPRCKKTHPIHIDAAIRDRNVVEQCAVCKGRELFIRKDFPQRLGAAIVVVFGLAAIYAFTFNVLVGWSILAASAGPPSPAKPSRTEPAKAWSCVYEGGESSA